MNEEKINDKKADLVKKIEKNQLKKEKIMKKIVDVEIRITEAIDLEKKHIMVKHRINELKDELDRTYNVEECLAEKTNDINIKIRTLENEIKRIKEILVKRDDNNKLLEKYEIELKDKETILFHYLKESDEINRRKNEISLNKKNLKNELEVLIENENQENKAIIEAKSFYDKLNSLKNKIKVIDSENKSYEDKIKDLDLELSDNLSKIKNDQAKKIKKLEQDIELLQKQLNSDKSKFVDIKKSFDYKDVVWPLATSYHIATKTTTENIAKAVNYFKFFELVAAFNSIVLISALPYKIYIEKKDIIWDNYKSFSNTSFGDWVGLYRRLNMIYRDLKKETYITIPFDESFYKTITQERINKALDPIPNIRNKSVGGHGGSIDEFDAEDIIEQLNPVIKDIYKELLPYSYIKLLYPTNMEKTEDGYYNIHVQKLEGAFYPVADKILTKNDMISKVLYLYNPENDERLKLNPKLIKFIKCRECKNWSVYIYNRIKRNYPFYISYQTEKHDYRGEKSTFEEFFDIE